ncbi:efflux transporter outer membrane subunit [Aestuariirhabdus litorea]|uniref:Efflux transporter outer membrane subunit n=1 Tax=Aestuariirhabdus litorea TaxID=2528527 RepID=A0A3P3VKZ3_9GAMM|nr:efflux transporter outer membrane subunit [Aestuariirhabdus litorea]RRJ82396.1 efflux transporter outer membrane subunit [Aestuariirhabdus litorea]RWW92559.1 efflux transporter outer membrane subunit [Endozoicomonadaceae bacterium GTF-13]
MPQPFQLTVSMLGCLLLASCSTIDSRVEPSTPIVANQWSADELQQQMDREPWLDSFSNSGLNQLVAEALAANYSLRAARARSEVALAKARIAGADRYPELNAGLDALRRKQTQGGESTIDNSFSAELELVWELDLWGRLDASTQAALNDYLASQAEFEQARFQLAADVASAWFNLSEARMQLDLVERRLNNQSSNLEIIRQNYLSGLSDSLDLYLARADLEGDRSRRQARLQTLKQRTRELEILLGRYPATALEAPASVPTLTEPPPAGLPSELLQRRQDLIAARLSLRAADLRAEEAHLQRYPRLRLTATGGTRSDELGDLLRSDYLGWSLLGGLTAPLFNAGRLEAGELQARARTREAEADYSATVQRAFAEVEQALGDEGLLLEQQRALKNAATDSISAEKLAFESYRSGLVEFVTVLESQRRSFDAQSAEIEVRNRLLQNRINLYLALGGDFALSPSPLEEP